MDCSPSRLLCPWDSPGENTEVACDALLQGIFPTQGSNPCPLHFLHCRWIPYLLSHQGSPRTCLYNYKGLVSEMIRRESWLVDGPLTIFSILVGVSLGLLGPIFENSYFSLRFLVHSSMFSNELI